MSDLFRKNVTHMEVCMGSVKGVNCMRDCCPVECMYSVQSKSNKNVLRDLADKH